MVPVDERDRRREGRARARADDRRRHGRGQALPRRARSRTCWPRAQPFGEWVGKIVDLERAPDATCPRTAAVRGRRAAPPPDRRRLLGRGAGAGAARRWPRTARRRSARWATTRRRRCCRAQYRPLSHYFRQNFSQVTNPPIDCLREHRVMSPEDPVRQPQERARRGQLARPRSCMLESPFVANARVRRDGRGSSATRSVDDRLHLRGGRRADALRRGWRASAPRPRTRCASGASHLVLTDEHQGAEPGGDADDPRDQRGAFLADPQGPADLHLAQRPLGRVHRPALLRGADRLGRDDGERLPRAGFDRRPRSRAG